MRKADFCWLVSGMLSGSKPEPACAVKIKLAKRQRARSTALAAPGSHLLAGGGHGDLLACPLQTPAPFPAPAAMATGTARADPGQG